MKLMKEVIHNLGSRDHYSPWELHLGHAVIGDTDLQEFTDSLEPVSVVCWFLVDHVAGVKHEDIN